MVVLEVFSLLISILMTGRFNLWLLSGSGQSVCGGLSGRLLECSMFLRIFESFLVMKECLRMGAGEAESWEGRAAA